MKSKTKIITTHTQIDAMKLIQQMKNNAIACDQSATIVMGRKTRQLLHARANTYRECAEMVVDAIIDESATLQSDWNPAMT